MTRRSNACSAPDRTLKKAYGRTSWLAELMKCRDPLLDLWRGLSLVDMTWVHLATYPIGHWQILFVLGYLVSDQLGRLRDAEGRLAVWWLALISAGFATLLLLRNGAALGLFAPSSSISRAFVKVPMSPAELGWYVTASGFVLSWSAWLWERAPWLNRPLGEVCRLGRKSLLVYVAHLYLQLPILEVLALLDPPPWGRGLVLPFSVVILIGVAMAGEGLDRMLAARTRARPLLPTSGIVGSAFAVGAFLTVISLRELLGMPAGSSSGPIDGAAYQADAGERQVSLEAPDSFNGSVDTLPWLPPEQPAEDGAVPNCQGGEIEALCFRPPIQPSFSVPELP
jgi:hypothetical protein